MFHLSDFNRLKNVKFWSDTFAICNTHIDLTSKLNNVTLDHQSRAIIAEIKLNEISRVQEKLQLEVENRLLANRNNSLNNTTLRDDESDLRSTLTEKNIT